MPDVFWETPIPLIELALDGKVDFIRRTNPWGSGEEDEDGATPPTRPAAPPDHGKAASGLAAMLRGHANYRKG